MNLLKDKKGIIIGVANDRSICYCIAKECLKNGAKLALSYTDLTESRVKKIFEENQNVCRSKCDCGNDDSIKCFFEFVKEKFGNIDFIVCAPVFVNKEALKEKYLNISRDDFLLSMNISVYSLTAICKIFEPILNQNSSILTLSYYGAEKVVPGYNIMGVVKSALESSVRYLATDLGKKGVRVNSISPGAIRTLSSSVISSIKKTLHCSEKYSPLHKNITQQDVANMSLFLLSDLSSSITAENIHVDAGLNSIGLFFDDEK